MPTHSARRLGFCRHRNYGPSIADSVSHVWPSTTITATGWVGVHYSEFLHSIAGGSCPRQLHRRAESCKLLVVSLRPKCGPCMVDILGELIDCNGTDGRSGTYFLPQVIESIEWSEYHSADDFLRKNIVGVLLVIKMFVVGWLPLALLVPRPVCEPTLQ